MPDVFIIGGGLSGLAAALECQRLGIACRIIEVKGRVGGSLATERLDGWTLDTGPFAFQQEADWQFLEPLGLPDALYPLYPGTRSAGRVAFRGGTQVLIDALRRAITAPVLHRMAVSSIGQIDGHFTLCLENGLMWEAAGVIVAAPARFAERMFRTLVPEVSTRLFDYPYDAITRLALGFRKVDLPDPGRAAWDMGFPAYDYTDHPDRVPAGHWLLQVGVRYPLDRTTPEAILSVLRRDFKWRAEPVIQRMRYWSEADPIPPHHAGFSDQQAILTALLPAGIALAGSDYAGTGLAERIESGRAAARRMAAV
jgi:protoporphyrinogen oxidase